MAGSRFVQGGIHDGVRALLCSHAALPPVLFQTVVAAETSTDAALFLVLCFVTVRTTSIKALTASSVSISMTGFEGALLGMGNPLLDIISDVDQAFLDKYEVFCRRIM